MGKDELGFEAIKGARTLEIVEDICNMDIKSRYKIILIKSVITDWRDV